ITHRGTVCAPHREHVCLPLRATLYTLSLVNTVFASICLTILYETQAIWSPHLGPDAQTWIVALRAAAPRHALRQIRIQPGPISTSPRWIFAHNPGSRFLLELLSFAKPTVLELPLSAVTPPFFLQPNLRYIVTLQLFDTGETSPALPSQEFLLPCLRHLHISSGHAPRLRHGSYLRPTVIVHGLLESLLPSATRLEDLHLLIKDPVQSPQTLVLTAIRLLAAVKESLRSLTIAFHPEYKSADFTSSLRSLTVLESYSEIPCAHMLPGALFFDPLQSAPLAHLPDSVTTYTLHHDFQSRKLAPAAGLCRKVLRDLAADTTLLPNLQVLAGVALDTDNIPTPGRADVAALNSFDTTTLLPPLLAARPNLRTPPLAAHGVGRYPQLDGWSL
ncbi:hypothetical protein P7C70_g9545, partial [Phenoliferia sp. Uapishka_3]